ncbi:hypothetical protein [Nonomuraea sp. NPDC050691]
MPDLMLVTTLRAWFDHPQRHAPVWYRVKDDSVVGADVVTRPRR